MNIRARIARLLPINNLSFRNRILAVEESDYRKEIENNRQYSTYKLSQLKPAKFFQSVGNNRQHSNAITPSIKRGKGVCHLLPTVHYVGWKQPTAPQCTTIKIKANNQQPTSTLSLVHQPRQYLPCLQFHAPNFQVVKRVPIFLNPTQQVQQPRQHLILATVYKQCYQPKVSEK